MGVKSNWVEWAVFNTMCARCVVPLELYELFQPLRTPPELT